MLQTLLSVAGVLAICAALVRGGSLILRQHQQRALQRWFEDATLRLDYLRPIQWYSKATSRTTIALLSLIAVLIGSSILTPLLRQAARSVADMNPLILLGAAMYNLWFMTKRINPGIREALDYMAGYNDADQGSKPSLKRFSKRCIRPILGWGAFTAISYVLVYALISFLLPHVDAVSLAVLLSIPFAFGFLAIFSSVLLVWFLTGIIALGHASLIMLRGACWRIAEYQKGVFEALLLVVTTVVALGMVFWK